MHYRRLADCRRGAQRHRQSAARTHRLRLWFLGANRRLRHHPDADRVFVAGLDLWPCVLGRPAEYAAGRRHSASSLRPSSASSSAFRGCRRTGWCRKVAGAYVEIIRNTAAAAAIAVLVQRRAQGAAGHPRQLSASSAAASSTIAACSCRGRFSSRLRRGLIGIALLDRRGCDRRLRLLGAQTADGHRTAARRCFGFRSVLIDRLAAAGRRGHRLSGRIRVSRKGPVQYSRRRRSPARIRRAAVRARDLHGGLHRRSGARRHPGGLAMARPKPHIRSGCGRVRRCG